MENLLAAHLQAHSATIYHARLPIIPARLALNEEMQAAERFSLHPCDLRRCTQQNQVLNDDWWRVMGIVSHPDDCAFRALYSCFCMRRVTVEPSCADMGCRPRESSW
jgi:hypothetical protein